MMNAMTIETAAEKAPSIMTESHICSSKYRPVTTKEIAQEIISSGWSIVDAGEQKSKKKAGFQPHMIRFTQPDLISSDDRLDMILFNSNDGTKCYELRLGVYRFVCANGMVCGQDQFSLKVKHIGNQVQNVLDASTRIIEMVPEIQNQMEIWKAIELDQQQQSNYAATCYDALEKPQEGVYVDPNIKYSLNTIYRTEDNKGDLWTTFNRVQENVIRARNYKIVGTNGKLRKKRPVKAMLNDISTNMTLWNVTANAAASLIG